ncbi:lipopolysaccharide biosynthesis protein [Roseovarius sp. Pro17]|uniref:GumC family protein n=1 Tax=Roseovarius sp. Pro17 TaxID=3108175 RepID=UPI002D780C0C|nr:lipopolysaccharide biosynthesis protein [Roseovarius sp. Pro17]
MLKDVKFYIALFFRRLHYFLVIIVVCTAAGLTLAFTLPPVYRAEATLVVEPAQIPGDLAASTVQATVAEILDLIKRRILTRQNLLDISRRFEVHAAAERMTADAIVADMRQRISMQFPNNTFTNRALFVTVSFDAPTGEISARVGNELVTQILRQNIEMRTSATGQTLEFFVQEVARLDEEMGQQNSRILTFKESNKDTLPDSLDYRRNRQASLQERVLQLERELSGLRDRRDRLVEIYERTGRLDIMGENLTPEQRQLQQLKDELASAGVIYSDENPRVKSLKAQIAALEAANIKLGLGTAIAPNVTIFDLQMSDIDGQITFIEKEKELIQKQIDALTKSIEATPMNAITLGTLERDYENLQLQYTQARASLAEARTGDQIEAQSRGQRITVTEQAIVPAFPAEPNRKLIAAAGIAGGFGLSIALFLLLEILNSTIRRPAELTSRLGVTAFGTIPYIQTDKQVFRRRTGIVMAVVVPLIVLAGGLYILHVNYMPIDMLIQKVADKVSFNSHIPDLQGQAYG